MWNAPAQSATGSLSVLWQHEHSGIAGLSALWRAAQAGLAQTSVACCYHGGCGCTACACRASADPDHEGVSSRARGRHAAGYGERDARAGGGTKPYTLADTFYHSFAHEHSDQHAVAKCDSFADTDPETDGYAHGNTYLYIISYAYSNPAPCHANPQAAHTYTIADGSCAGAAGPGR